MARLPFAVPSVTLARALVTDLLETHGTSRAVVAEANIVVGELVMNAVRHGRPMINDEIEIAWALASDYLRFSVCDGGQVDHLEAHMPDVTSFGGRGLAMVDIICLRWAYDTTDGTRIIADIPTTAA